MIPVKKLAKLSVLLPLGGILLFFISYLLPHFYFKTTGGKLEMLDMLGSYTLLDVTDLFNTLGSEGIKHYKVFLQIDFLFPLIYGSTLVLMLIYLQEKMGRLGKLTAWMHWLPVGVVLLDYVENTNTWFLLSSFPTLSESAVRFGSIVTLLKWYSASLCVMLVVCALLAVALRNILWKWKKQKLDS